MPLVLLTVSNLAYCCRSSYSLSPAPWNKCKCHVSCLPYLTLLTAAYCLTYSVLPPGIIANATCLAYRIYNPDTALLTAADHLTHFVLPPVKLQMAQLEAARASGLFQIGSPFTGGVPNNPTCIALFIGDVHTCVCLITHCYNRS